ncbi:MAG: hypothetical protein WDO16_07645 [Bacteroidota bacterium]
MVKSGLLFLTILLTCGCSNNGDTDSTIPGDTTTTTSMQQDSSSRIVYNFTDTALQSKITDTLMQLSFVRESNRYIDSISGHKKAISFITDTANHEISVMAGYNGDERFETYYNFSIHPVTFEIKVMDAVSGDFVTVAEYLKRNKDQH